MRKLLVITIFFCSLSSFTQSSVDTVLESYKKDKDLQHANYSFCIMEASTGKIIKEYNSNIALIPASTLKIITTSAALGILGKDYSYKTSYYLIPKSDIVNGVFNGDVIVKGSGDPSFNSSYFYNTDSVFFNSFIKNTKSKGIKKINGNIIIDASYFDNSIPSDWIWGDIGNYFGASANGVSYKDNKFSLFYNSGLTNTEAKFIQVKPSYFASKMLIQSTVTAGGTEDNAFVYGDPISYQRLVTGTIPPNKINYEVEAQMPEPPMYLADDMKQLFAKNNLIDTTKVKCAVNQVPEKYSYNSKHIIYNHTSPTLDKIVFYTNVKSNNHYAESLLKTIGAVKSGKQGTTQNGINAIESYWKERGVDIDGLHMVDGSGLSRANTITTKLQATVLSKIYRDSLIYKSFNNSLPIAGKNGSMANLCKGTFAENNMRAKTGYINRARGYCGYVKTKSGRELAFSVLVNNYNCSAKEMKLKIEKLLVALVEL